MKDEKRQKRLREMTNVEICKENNIAGGIILTNAVDESISKNKIRATMQILAKALSSTLGPDGSTTLIQDREMKHLATKDGLDVISHMTFEDEIARTVRDLVYNISRNQVLAVGDGSTSAIIVANALYQELTNKENTELLKYASPRVVLDMLNYICDYLEVRLKEEGKPLSEDLKELKQIATISANNNEDVGEMMREIYTVIGKDGFISTDIMQNYERDFVEYKKGVTWGRGYQDAIFAERYEANKIVHDKPFIFITADPITADDCDTIYRKLIGTVCAPNQGCMASELVIIGNFFSEDAKNFFANVRSVHKLNPNRAELKFTYVDIAQSTEISRNTLKDIALLCGCDVFEKQPNSAAELEIMLDPHYTKPDKFKYLGRALKCTITKSQTELVCDDELLSEDRLKLKEIAISKLNSDIDALNKQSFTSNDDLLLRNIFMQRKSNLENLTAVIHVGGRTYEERHSRERLLEDAIFASKSAIKYGYSIGGNIMIPRILLDDKKKIINNLADKFDYLDAEKSFYGDFIDLLMDSFLMSYRSVLENSYILTDEKIDSIITTVLTKDKFYNLKTHKFEKFESTNVINSIDTDIQIMRSCISIIGLLATSNQVLTLNCNVHDQVIQ